MFQKKSSARPLLEADFPLYAVAVSPDNHVILGGGGGQSRTGVPNGMAVYSWGDSLQLVAKEDTGGHAVMNIAIHPKGVAVACGMDEQCGLYAFDTRAKGEKDSNEAVPANRQEDEAQAEDKVAPSGPTPQKEGSGTTLKAVCNAVTDFGKEPYQKAVQFSSDGTQLLTGGADGVVRLWEFPSMTMLKEFKGCTGEVRSVAIHPQKAQVAAAANSKDIIVWNSQVCTEVKRLVLEGNGQRFKLVHVSYVAGSHSVFLYGLGVLPGLGSYMGMWEATSWSMLRRRAVDPEPCTAFAVSPSKKYLAVGTSMGGVVILEAMSLQTLRRANNVHPIFVTGVAFSADNNKVISISADKQVMESSVAYEAAEQGVMEKNMVGVALAVLAVAVYYLLVHVSGAMKPM